MIFIISDAVVFDREILLRDRYEYFLLYRTFFVTHVGYFLYLKAARLILSNIIAVRSLVFNNLYEAFCARLTFLEFLF